MPLLKREPEIWPPDIFASGTEAADGTRADEPPAYPCEGGADRLPMGTEGVRGQATNGRWWVAYTRSRQEKRLARHLFQAKVPYYLPQREHRFRAGDRVRTSHLPLFTGYVFFRGDLYDRLIALRSSHIVNVIDPQDQERIASELRSLWVLQTTGEPLQLYPHLAPGDEVEINGGSLKGYRGLVLREKGKFRLVVSITLLRQSVAVDIDREMLTPSEMRPVRPRGTTPPAALASAPHGRARVVF